MVDKLIVLNWKAYLGVVDSVALAKHIAKKCGGFGNCLIVAPTAVALPVVSNAIANEFRLCAQNFDLDSGAHTGNITLDTLKEGGCKYILIGHSELRYGKLREDDGVISKKIAFAIRTGMTPIFCFGEKSEDRRANNTEKFIVDQIRSGISEIKKDVKHARVLFAYEPVWAISSSGSAVELDVADVEQVAKIVKKLISESGLDITQVFLYGGSVKPENIMQYMNSVEIDGVLVGKASTVKDSVDKLLESLQYANHKK